MMENIPTLPPGFVLEDDIQEKPQTPVIEPQVDNQSPQLPPGFIEEEPFEDQPFQGVNQELLNNYASGNLSERKMKLAGELKKRGFLENITEDISKRTGKVSEFIERQDSIADAPAIGAIAFSQAAGGVEDIAGELIASGFSAIVPEDVKETIKNTLGDLAKTDIGKMGLSALKQGSEAFDAFEKEYPDAAMSVRGALNLFGGSLATKFAGKAQIGKGLIDVTTGRPTKALEKILNKSGLDFDSLSTVAREALPEKLNTGIMKDITAKTIAEESIIKQIQSGGSDDALSKFMVKGGMLVDDELAEHTIKQGFTPGFVQSIKSSSPETKKKMLEMSGVMRRIKKNERLGLDNRPGNIIGDSVMARVNFIQGKSKAAAKEMKELIEPTLKGKEINSDGILNTLKDSLDDLDVTMSIGPDGVPVPEFKGSLISKDVSAKKAIKDVIDELSTGGVPDAERFHKLKKIFDKMINYKKKNPLGLSDDGEKIIRKIRRSLNDALRDVNPDYARVNDVMSQSLDALGNLDKAMGSIDTFGVGSNSPIGTRMRALMSNQQGRQAMDNAINDLNSVSKNLGGEFKDDVKSLVMFANGLDKRFGTVAETSFAGQTAQGVSAAMKLAKPSALKVAASVVGKGIGKVKGVTDLTSFDALENILKRQ